jgi:hypothetical protein
MLEVIPSEILTLITLHLTLSTHQPPIPLLQTSRFLNDSLNPKYNTRLYARLFRANFDSSAVERRIKGDITSNDLVQELRSRSKALGRLRRLVRRGDVSDVRDEDLWVIYVMLIENGMFLHS